MVKKPAEGPWSSPVPRVEMMVYLEQAARFSMGVATAPAARQTLRRAPLRLMSENMVIEMKVLVEKDNVLERMLEVFN